MSLSTIIPSTNQKGTGATELASCPEFLKPYADLPRWLYWRLTLSDGQFKKPPYNPRTGRLAKTSDPSTWGTFNEAVAALNNRGGDGIGFVLDGTDRLVCIDLDDCRDPTTGGMTDLAERLVHDLDAPTEISQSGEGIHVWVHADLPDTFSSIAPYEVYPDGSRFIAITNQFLTDHPATQNLPDRTNEVRKLIKQADESSGATNLSEQLIEMSDEAIVHAILAGPNGARWRKVQSYDFSDFYKEDAYAPDRSRVDFNVLLMIADYTANPDQVERIFAEQMPHLIRDDGWERDSYRTRSVNKAIARTSKSRERNANEESNTATHRWAAERFADLHAGDVRYNDGSRLWYSWDGQRFRPAELLEHQRLATEMIDSYRHELNRMPYSQERAAALKRARQLESKSALDGMLHIARADSRIAVAPDQLDANPWRFNVQNVTITADKTGRITVSDHDRADLITKVAPIEYEPSAKAPNWDAFLNRLFDNDQDLIRYVRALVGYSMLGVTFEKVLVFAVGPANTGKTTLLESIARMFGSEAAGGYAKKLAADFFLTKRYDNSEYDIARLQGVRFGYAAEADEGRKLAVSRLKELSGNDRLRGRHPYGKPFDFDPSHTLWFATNHLPVVTGSDQAIWERIRVIPCDVVIPADERDMFLTSTLAAEGSGMLNWALAGLVDVLQHGLYQLTPQAVRLATKAYEDDSDIINDWFVEQIEVTNDADDRIRSSTLYSFYTAWCKENNEQSLSHKKLGMWLNKRGYEVGQKDGYKFYRSIRLRGARTE